MNKYREFWICEHGNWYQDKNLAEEEQSEKSLTHVIEYSAYTETLTLLRECREILTFEYGDSLEYVE
jgi:hypothetical protein